jgi:hypothetical protein
MASTTIILYDRKHTNYRSEAGVLEIAEWEAMAAQLA